ncbi:MAG: hypothetical protein WA705_01120 [Candidatus Ozemobacteraceae bacterium]
MTKNIRGMAGDLSAFNHVAAKEKLFELMKSWIAFSNRIIQNPPWSGPDRSEKEGLLNTIAGDIGMVRKKIEDRKFQQAHDLLEPLVIRMSILMADAYRQTFVADLLKIELELNLLKPGLMETTSQEKASSTQLLRARFDALKEIHPLGELQNSFDELISQIDKFEKVQKNEEAENTREIEKAGKIDLQPRMTQSTLIHGRLLSAFDRFRDRFLQHPALTK